VAGWVQGKKSSSVPDGALKGVVMSYVPNARDKRAGATLAAVLCIFVMAGCTTPANTAALIDLHTRALTYQHASAGYDQEGHAKPDNVNAVPGVSSGDQTMGAVATGARDSQN
jgi:hypothetical protein